MCTRPAVRGLQPGKQLHDLHSQPQVPAASAGMFPAHAHTMAVQPIDAPDACRGLRAAHAAKNVCATREAGCLRYCGVSGND